MKCVLPVFGLVAGALAWSNDTIVYTTVTTDIYTTYCPESTTFTQGTKTYTATASETLTITDCPCTFTKPIKTLPPTSTPSVVPPTNSTTSLPPVWVTTTETVSSYTTYCPLPTSVVQGNKTYTVSEATTLTITNCPCTQTKTYPGTVTTITLSSLTTYCPVPTTITYSSATYPVTTTGSVTIPIVTYSTIPITSAPTVAPVSTVPVSSGLTTVASATKTPIKVTSTAATTGPALVTANAAAHGESGFGALALAGLAAMLL
jgi:hypothetical protein